MKNKRRYIGIFGIDSFEKKNVHQVLFLNSIGITSDVFTSDRYGTSIENIPKGASLHVLSKSYLGRMVQIIKYFLKNKNKLRHIEVYPGGRFAFHYILLAKLFNLKVIVVERGDIFRRQRVDTLTRWSMDFCYQHADLVWYREFYPNMNVKDKLVSLGAKRVEFIHNSIEIQKPSRNNVTKEFTFLWANSLKHFRYPEWMVEILKNKSFSKTNNILIGIDDTMTSKSVVVKHKLIKEQSLANLEIQGWVDPRKYYLSSSFFVLASDIVFLNNSLLESMSYGLIPIVSKVSGAELIVDDGVNGFLFDHSPKGLRKAMMKAMMLTASERVKMSEQAIIKIEKDFSRTTWNKKYLKMINSI